MLFNKFARKLLSTVITSVTFSLGFGGVNAITKEQKEAISSWAKMMKLSEDKVFEMLKFEAKDGKECYLVPIYKSEEVKKFLVDLFSNQEYKGYMEHYYEYGSMISADYAAARYQTSLNNMWCSKQANGYQYFVDGLSRSLNFLVIYDEKLVGKISLGPMRNLGNEDGSQGAVVINTKYSHLGIFSGILKIFKENIKFIMEAYDNDSKNIKRELKKFYTTPGYKFPEELCDTLRKFDWMELKNNEVDIKINNKVKCFMFSLEK